MERTWKPTTAGIMNIISGVIGIALGILILVFSTFIGNVDLNSLIQQYGGSMPGGTNIPSLPGNFLSALGSILVVVGPVFLVFGVLALVGGINALSRRRWGLALTGAILSLFIPVIGTILGILAIIFLSLGKKEFS